MYLYINSDHHLFLASITLNSTHCFIQGSQIIISCAVLNFCTAILNLHEISSTNLHITNQNIGTCIKPYISVSMVLIDYRC